MKILIVLPCFRHGWILEESLRRWGDVDKFIIDDNADQDVKEVIEKAGLQPNVKTDTDFYVNKCWNLGMKHFLKSDYDAVCLATIDTYMMEGWQKVVEANWKDKNEVLLPNFVELKNLDKSTPIGGKIVRHRGTGNFATFFTKDQIRTFYPIPEEVKLWYGDEWMFTLLRESGFKTVTVNDLYAHQFGSITINQNKKANNIIAQDQENWNRATKQKMIDKINSL